MGVKRKEPHHNQTFYICCSLTIILANDQRRSRSMGHTHARMRKWSIKRLTRVPFEMATNINHISKYYITTFAIFGQLKII